MKIGFSGTGYTSKVHVQAEMNIRLDVVLVANYK